MPLEQIKQWQEAMNQWEPEGDLKDMPEPGMYKGVAASSHEAPPTALQIVIPHVLCPAAYRYDGKKYRLVDDKMPERPRNYR